jgi:molybdopterin converting factor small subunit
MSATLFVPSMLRKLTEEQDRISVSGHNLREVMNDVASRYPRLRDAVLEDGRIRPGLALAVNGVPQSSMGLLAAVPDEAEIHILPAIAGGI